MVTLWMQNEIVLAAIAGLQDPQLSSRPSCFTRRFPGDRTMSLRRRRSYNVSTATIEEVDAELITPPEDWAAWGKENVVEDAVADRPALSKVPHSTPAVGSTECSDQAAPTTAPQSFGPSAQTGQDVEAEVTVE